MALIFSFIKDFRCKKVDWRKTDLKIDGHAVVPFNSQTDVATSGVWAYRT